jgi:hypothetical protein
VRRSNLDAEVCREIVREILDEEGPLTVGQLAIRMGRVFSINTAYLAMTLCKKRSGFVVDNGIVYATRRGK